MELTEKEMLNEIKSYLKQLGYKYVNIEKNGNIRFSKKINGESNYTNFILNQSQIDYVSGIIQKVKKEAQKELSIEIMNWENEGLNSGEIVEKLDERFNFIK